MKIAGVSNPVFYIGCPPAYEVVRRFQRDMNRPVIYERTDIFEEMPGVDREYISHLDKEMAARSDLVLYVNRQLWKAGMDVNPRSLLVGHGVDYNKFSGVDRDKDIPGDIVNLPKPIVGFFGDISEKTSDLALLEHTVSSLPNISFVFVGGVSTDITRIKKYANVYFLGRKPYDDIPRYGKMFDIAIMPWNQNKWIDFCNPVKTKEYLALGVPVVTMYYPEIEPYSDVVYVARDYEEFVSCIRRAAEEDDEEMRLKRRQRVEKETWECKVQMIMENLDKDFD